jgi:hypothetical protein
MQLAARIRCDEYVAGVDADVTLALQERVGAAPGRRIARRCRRIVARHVEEMVPVRPRTPDNYLLQRRRPRKHRGIRRNDALDAALAEEGGSVRGLGAPHADETLLKQPPHRVRRAVAHEGGTGCVETRRTRARRVFGRRTERGCVRIGRAAGALCCISVARRKGHKLRCIARRCPGGR